MTTYVLDGGRIGTLDDFWTLMGEAVNGSGGYFGRNLDSFVDCLRGGFGTPDDGGFVIEWRDHEPSRRALGHPETARHLEGVLARCHPTNRARVAEELAQARSGRGPTLFGILTEIIENRAPGTLRLR
ncbi:barstar family protein [Streptomyces sp. NPDC127051]|uniref:barstar family protein n=1 Tax=Streptomyces sp. NPDC127051 TaxID=3347119 RepID=UPI003650AA0E